MYIYSIFVLQNKDDEKELICSYNIDETKKINVDNIPKNTIGVHRKKQTNTLYTINALNELIKTLNNGIIDKSFAVNWDNYKNCILLIQTEGFNRIDTKVKEIINL